MDARKLTAPPKVFAELVLIATSAPWHLLQAPLKSAAVWHSWPATSYTKREERKDLLTADKQATEDEGEIVPSPDNNHYRLLVYRSLRDVCYQFHLVRAEYLRIIHDYGTTSKATLLVSVPLGVVTTTLKPNHSVVSLKRAESHQLP